MHLHGNVSKTHGTPALSPWQETFRGVERRCSVRSMRAVERLAKSDEPPEKQGNKVDEMKRGGGGRVERERIRIPTK